MPRRKFSRVHPQQTRQRRRPAERPQHGAGGSRVGTPAVLARAQGSQNPGSPLRRCRRPRKAAHCGLAAAQVGVGGSLGLSVPQRDGWDRPGDCPVEPQRVGGAVCAPRWSTGWCTCLRPAVPFCPRQLVLDVRIVGICMQRQNSDTQFILYHTPHLHTRPCITT